MILVTLKNGLCIEVEAATRALRLSDSLVCYDSAGVAVATFPAADVQVFTHSETVARALKDEVCDDVSHVPADQTRPFETKGS
jgi:hypothetical protein